MKLNLTETLFTSWNGTCPRRALDMADRRNETSETGDRGQILVTQPTHRCCDLSLTTDVSVRRKPSAITNSEDALLLNMRKYQNIPFSP